MKGDRKFSLKHIWAVIILLLSNALFFLTIWLSNKYDHVSLDQFIYQAKTSAVGANRSIMNSAYIRVGLLTFLLTAVESLLLLFFSGKCRSFFRKIFRSEAKYKKVTEHKLGTFFVKHIVPVTLAILIFSLSFFTKKLNFVQYVKAITTDSTFIENHYVDPRSVTLTYPEQKRNLIYIFLESLEVTFAEPEAGGLITENFMPELSALAENNINFSNDTGLGGALSYYGSTWTAAAMVAQTSGTIVQVPVQAQNYGGEDPYIPGLVSIGEILADAGYSNTLLVGSNAEFADRDDYFLQHGNYDIIDTESLKAEGRLDEDYRVWWGFEDYMLFEYAKEELTRLAAEDQPFNFTMLTCDTHFPDGYVCEHCEDTYEEQYPNVVRCSSKQLNDFIRWIQAQPFYENTTIVLCGDHLTMDPQFMQTINENYTRTIYNCIINSAVTPAKEKNRQFGTFDMLPTTLAAMGVSIDGDRLGLGTNLFSSIKTITEKFGFQYVNDEFQKNSQFYNKELLGM